VCVVLEVARWSAFASQPGDDGSLLVAGALAKVEAAFLAQIARGTFELVHLAPADLVRMSELVIQYADFPLGAVDASVIAVAERFGVDRVATLDRRHFTVVKPMNVAAFTLLP
jgi:predicted nucleic acid-binding protein